MPKKKYKPVVTTTTRPLSGSSFGVGVQRPRTDLAVSLTGSLLVDDLDRWRTLAFVKQRVRLPLELEEEDVVNRSSSSGSADGAAGAVGSGGLPSADAILTAAYSPNFWTPWADLQTSAEARKIELE